MATITKSARTLRAKARFYRSEDGKHAAAARRSFKRAANRAERRAVKAEEERLRILALMGEDDLDEDEEIDDDLFEEEEDFDDEIDEDDLFEDEEFESDSNFEDITEDNDDDEFYI